MTHFRLRALLSAAVMYGLLSSVMGVGACAQSLAGLHGTVLGVHRKPLAKAVSQVVSDQTLHAGRAWRYTMVADSLQIQPGRPGAESLSGDVVYRRQGYQRAAQRAVEGWRRSGSRVDTGVRATGQRLIDGREAQDPDANAMTAPTTERSLWAAAFVWLSTL